MTRAFAGAMVLALAAAGASSTSRAHDAVRIAWERAGAAIAAAATSETDCVTTDARTPRAEGDCAADDASREDSATQPEQRTTPASRPATGVCARNPETGRRKCSVRYLA